MSYVIYRTNTHTGKKKMLGHEVMHDDALEVVHDDIDAFGVDAGMSDEDIARCKVDLAFGDYSYSIVDADDSPDIKYAVMDRDDGSLSYSVSTYSEAEKLLQDVIEEALDDNMDANIDYLLMLVEKLDDGHLLSPAGMDRTFIDRIRASDDRAKEAEQCARERIAANYEIVELEGAS